MKKSARIIFTPSKEMYEALESVSKEQNKPMSALIREGVAIYLKRFGREVDTGLAWGGDRSKEKED